MENLKQESERFIRSFLYNLYEKEIIELDIEKQPELKNPVVYVAAYNLEEWAHHILWVDVEKLNMQSTLEYCKESPLLTEILNNCRGMSSDYMGTTINFYSAQLTIINKRKLGEKEFWDDILYLNKLHPSPSKRLNIVKSFSYTEQLDNKNLETKTKLIEKINEMPSALDSIYENKRKEKNQEIDNLIEQLKVLKQELKQIDMDYITRFIQDENNSIFNKLINFIDKCKYVSHYIIYGPTTRRPSQRYSVYILLRPFPISYTYGDDAATKLIYESVAFRNHTNKDIIMDAITSRTRYEIYHKPVIISISYRPNDETGLTWNVEKPVCSKIRLIDESEEFQRMYADNQGFENRHYFRFNCLGSFRTDLALAQDALDPTRLFATLLQYLQTINLADYAGNQWLQQDHMVYDKLENKLILVQAQSGNIIPINHSIESLEIIAQNGYYKKGN